MATRGTRLRGGILFWVTLLALGVALAHLRFQIELLDEGVLDMGAWRIAQGELPYRDFFAFYTPLSFYLVAITCKLFGPMLLPGRILAFGVGAVLVVASGRLAKRVVPSPLFAAIPVAVLCQAGLGIWPFASHHWLASVFTILAVLSALAALSGNALLWSSLAGLSAAGAFWSLNNPGLLLVALVGVLHVPWLPPGKRKPVLEGWGLGILVGSLPFLVLLLKIAPRTLWYDLYVFPLTAYKSLPGNRYGITFPLHELARQWSSGAWRGAPLYTAAVTLCALFVYVAPLASLPLLALAFRRKWTQPAQLGLIAAGTLSFVATIAWRFGPINLQWSAVFPALVVAWALARAHASGALRVRVLSAGLAWILVACFCFVGIYRIGKTLAPGVSYAVRAPAGTLYSFDRVQAARIQETIDQIQAQLKPGEPLLTRAVPLFNFLTSHPNPTRIDLFVPPSYSPEPQMREVIGVLEAERLAWILTPAFVPGENTFDRYLLAHYALAWDNGEYGLWRRNP